MKILKPHPHSFLDFKVYLKDLFDWKQSLQASYTQRDLAQDAGIALGLFTKIIAGQRTLSAKVMFKLSEVFELNDQDSEDLELLVLYNQSKTQQEKLERLKDLISFRSSHVTTNTLDQSYFWFYTEWHHSAIREVISSGSFKGSFKELGDLLIPSISTHKTKESIELLTNLKLIKEISSEQGSYEWQVIDPLISSDAELAKTSVRKFNQDMIDKGKEALDLMGPESRNISTVTLSIDEDKYELIADKVREFRKEIMEFAVADEDSNKVYQMNMQLFPLSHRITKEDKGD